MKLSAALTVFLASPSLAFTRPPTRSTTTTALHESIASNILDLVGNTPLIQLNRVTEGAGAQVVCKLESQNPANSVKDRIAMSMILEAEKRGDITPGETILVEPTVSCFDILGLFACVQLLCPSLTPVSSRETRALDWQWWRPPVGTI